MNESMPTIEELKSLKETMFDIGTRINTYGESNYVKEHGLQMIGAANILQTWINGLNLQ